jgi:GntR family transcriptional regulator
MARYLQIADDLRAQIVASGYPPGFQLPSNSKLALDYRTSLGTLRRALELLHHQGWIRIEHGNGTFVADVGAHRDMLASLSAEDLDGASRLETVLVGVREEPGSPDARAALGLRAGEPVACVERLRLIDGQPLILQSSYVAADVQVVAGYRAHEPLYAFLRARFGLMAARSDEEIVAGELDAADAEVLGQRAGTIILRARRTSFTFDGTPIVFDDARIVTGRLSLHIHRQGRDTRAAFALHYELSDGR